MSTKLLTLAVPTYNMEKYLPRCLDSVLCENQEFLEVIVVNDGSIDHSSAIAHEFETKYPNLIRVIDKENGNYGSCVNRALDEATGKYFRMLDADDWCDTAALNQWLSDLKTCDADMVLTVAEDRAEDGRLLKTMNAPALVQEGKIYNAEDFDGMMLGYSNLFCSHIVTYKTSILKRIELRLQHGISYTDNEYVFFPLDHIHSVVYYNVPVYQYFVGRDGQTTQPEILFKQSEQILKVFCRLFEYYNEHKKNLNVAVLNNQRILLCELLNWIYSPLLWKPISKEKRELLKRIERVAIEDSCIYSMIGQRIIMLRFYRKTGLYPDSIIARMYQLIIGMSAYVKRVYATIRYR